MRRVVACLMPGASIPARDYDLGERAAALAEIEAHLEALVALGLTRRA